MKYLLKVLKAKHRRQVRKTNQGLKAHQAKLARIRAKEEDEIDICEKFTAEEFADYMRRKRGCGPV
jgi:hypothetical protein